RSYLSLSIVYIGTSSDKTLFLVKFVNSSFSLMLFNFFVLLGILIFIPGIIIFEFAICGFNFISFSKSVWYFFAISVKVSSFSTMCIFKFNKLLSKEIHKSFLIFLTLIINLFNHLLFIYINK